MNDRVITLSTALAAAALSFALPASAAGPHARFAVPAAAPVSSWLSTETHGMPLSTGTDVGPVPATLPMKVVLGLVPANGAAAVSYVKHEYTPGDPLYHAFVTPAQFASAFGPTPAAASAAAQYLTAQGFRNVTVLPGRDLVSGEATAATVEAAFATAIHSFNLHGSAVYVNVTDAKVPAALRGAIQSVLGLTSLRSQLNLAYPGYHPANLATLKGNAQGCGEVSIKAANLCAIREFTTSDFRTVYDDGGSPTGHNTTVSIMSIGDLTGVISDLRLNEKLNGLRQVPVTVVPVDYQSDEEYGTTEFDMDSQTSSGVAGDLKGLNFYNMGELYESEIAEAFDKWVTDDSSQVASASFGECEVQAALDGGMLAEDFILLQAVAQGQTLFASAGDAGSTCGFTIVTNGTVPGDGPPQVEYPATSPWVMGAGGTSLFANLDGGYYGEISWNSGGGGVSFFEGPPFWSAGVSPGVVPVYSGIAGPGIAPLLGYNSGRTVPDVAMDADATISAADFYQGGALGSNGGTSLASPLAAGVFSRVQSHYGNKLGNAGPYLYAQYLKNGGGLGKVSLPPTGKITGTIGGFHDIVLGANGAFTALPGYDMNTGMGSFDILRTVEQY